MNKTLWLAPVFLFGCKAVITEGDAPFKLRGKVQLWIEDTSSDREDGAGLLVITDQDITCRDAKGVYFGELFEELFAEGQGLALLASYSSWGDNDFGKDPFPGLFSSGYAYSYDPDGGLSRSMVPTAFEDGFTYGVGTYSSGESWLRIEEMDKDLVRGDFGTPWWRGRIKAEVCKTDGGAGGVCDVANVEEFYDEYLTRYCDEWEACGNGPCPVSTGYTTGGYCPDFNPAAAEQCLCGAWTCNNNYPGFEFPEPDPACFEVCGYGYYYPG